MTDAIMAQRFFAFFKEHEREMGHYLVPPADDPGFLRLRAAVARVEAGVAIEEAFPGTKEPEIIVAVSIAIIRLHEERLNDARRPEGP